MNEGSVECEKMCYLAVSRFPDAKRKEKRAIRNRIQTKCYCCPQKSSKQNRKLNIVVFLCILPKWIPDDSRDIWWLPLLTLEGSAHHIYRTTSNHEFQCSYFSDIPTMRCQYFLNCLVWETERIFLEVLGGCSLFLFSGQGWNFYI